MRGGALGWASAAVLACVLAVAAGCGGSSDQSESAGAQETGRAGPIQYADPAPGGIYRVGTTDFGFTNLLDPTGEYSSTGWNIMSNLLVRTLVSHPLTAGNVGNELVPDLAESVPEPDGLTYTFRLKPGVRFGPPVDREVTSADIAYAFERMATPALVAQYGYQYEPIAGFTQFSAGKADGISGIRTPDPRTISFTLTQPVGDFLERLALPATGPIPEEVATCDTGPGDYGRHLIATGPYMLEGSGDLDASTCDSLEPISGYDPTARLSLVRNPSYDPATDDPTIREALPDGFLFEINSNRRDIFERITRGACRRGP
jgi:peptide/nickel transport system substrate-binding protein